LVDRERGKSEKEPNTVPKTKAACTEEFKREVLAHMACTGQSLNQTTTHFGVSTNSLREWRARRPSCAKRTESRSRVVKF